MRSLRSFLLSVEGLDYILFVQTMTQMEVTTPNIWKLRAWPVTPRLTRVSQASGQKDGERGGEEQT